MSEEPVIEKFYQRQAQEFVDMLFDAGLFKAKLRRKDMRAVEDLVGYIFQSQADTALKVAELNTKLKGV